MFTHNDNSVYSSVSKVYLHCQEASGQTAEQLETSCVKFCVNDTAAQNLYGNLNSLKIK